MKAVLVPVGEMPREVEVDGLEDLQAAVGGWIEAAPFVFDDAPAVYINEEGKFTCPPNRAIYATREGIGWSGEPIHVGDLLDIIYGDFVCIGFDPDTGDSRDISEEEKGRVFQTFGTPESVESGYAEARKLLFRSL